MNEFKNSATDTWNVIYQSMTPFEKGTFNLRQRKAKIAAKKNLNTSTDQHTPTFKRKHEQQGAVKNKKIDIIDYIDIMKKRYGE